MEPVEFYGPIEPDAMGDFVHAGYKNGKAYGYNAAKGWYLWWDGDETFNISVSLEGVGTAYFTNTTGTMIGYYYGGGTATGIGKLELKG